MKRIKYFLLSFLLSAFLGLANPINSVAITTDTNVTVSEASNYIEYVYIDGVRYKYIYDDDGKLIEIDIDE